MRGGGRRDRVDVILAILETIYTEKSMAKPTHIMYKANLSHKLMDGYFTELIDKGIIEKIDVKGKTRIALTDKGSEFLRELRKMKAFMQSFGL